MQQVKVYYEKKSVFGSYKICLKYKIPKFEIKRVKLNDFTRAESWIILIQKMVVEIVLSKYHVGEGDWDRTKLKTMPLSQDPKYSDFHIRKTKPKQTNMY